MKRPLFQFVRNYARGKTNKQPSNKFVDKTDGMKPFKIGGKFPGLKFPYDKTIAALHELPLKIHDFSELRLLPQVRETLFQEVKHSTILRNQNNISLTKKIKSEDELNGLIIRPTPIQTVAVKVLTATKNNPEALRVSVLSAETGSGKTWAYLAPLFDHLKHEERKADWKKNQGRAGIRSVILVPTHELVNQVYATLQEPCENLDLKPFKWDVKSNFKEFMGAFREKIDVLVTTPAKLLSLTKYDDVGQPQALFSSLSFAVVDEADTLMDPTWIQDTYSLIKYFYKAKEIVFCSATIPKEFKKIMEKIFPDYVTITTPDLHRLPKSLDFKVINATFSPYKGSRLKAAAQALYAIHCDGTEPGYEKRVIVFVNDKQSCETVSEKLRTKYEHDVTFISGNDSPETRAQKIQPFIDPSRRLDEGEKPALKVLVTTDLLARGINFSGVRNVILYDTPPTSVDVLHRSGRTGRMNQRGRVFMIVLQTDSAHVRGLEKVVVKRRRFG